MRTEKAPKKNLILTLVAASGATGVFGAPVVSPAIAAVEASHASAPAPPGAAAPDQAGALPKPPVSPEVGSYDIGLMLGSQLTHNGAVPSVSLDSVIRGLKDAVAGRVATAEERDAALRVLHDAREAFAAKNRAAGKAFLERNAKEPGIKSMPSGLQYRVLSAGDLLANSPLPTDDVTVRYRASLSDGTEIDRSDAHDRPATFRVNAVFKGWQEALLAMKPGAKWRLFVPPELSYGSNPPPAVPPGATLVYDLELLRTEPAARMDPSAVRGRPAARTDAPATTPH